MNQCSDCRATKVLFTFVGLGGLALLLYRHYNPDNGISTSYSTWLKDYLHWPYIHGGN